jgi:hypothetical protein
MKVYQPKNIGNVVPLRARSEADGDLADDPGHDNIMRLLDLSKYERPRHAAENYRAGMRANIAAMVFLGLLVFVAAEDFCRLEQSNQCLARSQCEK